VDDVRYMREALTLAEQGRSSVSPNPVVGCVIVRNNRIVGRGYHRRYGACHAETAAIANAGRRARGGTMYVTLQPCNHFGKTPPCVDAVIRSGVKRLVVAALDPNPKTMCAAGVLKLRAAGIRVKTGICELEARRQNEVYFHNLEFRRPFVALKLASTLDGMIADIRGRSRWITGPAARVRVQNLRAKYDAVLVGAGTVQTDNPRLTCRIPDKRHPVRVVLDHSLETPPGARLLKCPGRTIIFCSERVPARKRQRLSSARVEVVGVHEQKRDRQFWLEILAALDRQRIASVLVEGGAQVAASALKARVVSKLYLFLAPRILGAGKSFSAGLGATNLNQAIPLNEWQTESVGSDVLVTGYFKPIRNAE
jgi:diaminohydroxyphosphoribosylaminopyrimidine deaminase/5-amino-6-(5-phosphoribosylamino)uracil reductase